MESNALAQTYVQHSGKWFFVSTIDRDSSALCGGRYAETMVWQWNPDTRERGAIVGQGEACEGSIRRHQQIVERIFKDGLCEEPEGE